MRAPRAALLRLLLATALFQVGSAFFGVGAELQVAVRDACIAGTIGADSVSALPSCGLPVPLPSAAFFLTSVQELQRGSEQRQHLQPPLRAAK